MAKVNDAMKAEAIMQALTGSMSVEEAIQELANAKTDAPGGAKLEAGNVPEFTKAEILFFLKQKNRISCFISHTGLKSSGYFIMIDDKAVPTFKSEKNHLYWTKNPFFSEK